MKLIVAFALFAGVTQAQTLSYHEARAKRDAAIEAYWRCREANLSATCEKERAEEIAAGDAVQAAIVREYRRIIESLQAPSARVERVIVDFQTVDIRPWWKKLLGVKRSKKKA